MSRKNRSAVNKENLLMLKKLSLLGTGLMGIMTLFAFLFPYLYRMQRLYPPYFIAYALICTAAFCFAEKRRAYLFVTGFALICVTAIFGMELGIFYTLSGNANLYMVFLIILPMLFITPPSVTMLSAFLLCAVFSLLSLLYKDVAHYEIDITNCWVSYIISMVGTRMITAARAENIDARRRLYSESNVDGLTRLNNRRAFNAYIDALHPLLLSGKTRAVIYMIDIDCFKDYNDTYGHVDGDDCLVELGRIFGELSKELGLYFARYGGEEFVAVGTSEELNAEEAGRRIVQTVFERQMLFSTSPYNRVTVSVGCADSFAGGGENDFDLISNADIALYRAKEGGHNRLAIYRGAC